MAILDGEHANSFQKKMPSCVTCSKPSKLQCPNCVKLGIAGSHFCSQECFKASWASHKKAHNKVSGPFDPWPNYRYSGSLRPVYPLSATRAVKENIAKPDYASHPNGYALSEQALRGSSQITVLKPEEIEKMKIVCRMGREVMEAGASAIKIGATTDEVDRVVHEACMERNCYPSPLNYYKFPKSCCTSVNEVICHGIPDQYKLQDGDICNLDISVYYDGFHSDLNETFLVGNVDEAGVKLVTNARRCLDEAIKMGIFG